MSQILSDELGQSFHLKDSESPVLKGKECILTNVNTVASIAEFIGTSLGPTGRDKILISQDNIVTVTNDGATILKEMDMSTNPISQLILQLSQSQDEEVGDGTTSIVVLASAILQQAKRMIEKNIHPIKIAEGFSVAMNMAIEHLNKIGEPINDKKEAMLKSAKTTLSSKVAGMVDLAEICVDAVLLTADMERKDLDMDLINIESKIGSSISETKLVKGIVINKQFSHSQMPKEIKNAKVALLSCPFEPPKLKNKNSLLIKSAEEFKALENYEKETFKKMIDSLKDAGAEVVVCQWGFDDEANSLLLQNGIPAIRWVGGHDLGLMAAHTGASIVARFEDLNSSCLGVANVREESLNTENDKIIIVESPNKNKSVTILVRGSNDYIIEETKRSLRDALCAVRNILTNTKIIYGGGSSEINTSINLSKAAKEFQAETEEAIKAFSLALLEIPITLAANSGFDALTYVENLIELQLNSNDHLLGVDCHECGEKNMKKLDVFEALNSKIRQLQMATELVCMILKINDVIHI